MKPADKVKTQQKVKGSFYAKKYQEKFGYPDERTAGKVKSEMSVDSGIHQQIAVCVLTTSDANGDCDASPKTVQLALDR